MTESGFESGRDELIRLVFTLTQSEDVVDLATSIAGAAAAKVVAKVLIATGVVVVAAGDGVGEVAGRRVGETATISRPAETGVQVQLGPAFVVLVDLAIGLKHHGAASVSIQVGQGEIGAGCEETAGG